MVAGHYGRLGPSAQRLVGMEVRDVYGPVPIPRQSMEESAWDQTRKQSRVLWRIALVCETSVVFLNGWMIVIRVSPSKIVPQKIFPRKIVQSLNYAYCDGTKQEKPLLFF